MTKLTVLIFSKGQAENTIGLVRDIYNIADEVVLMDSSRAKDRKTLFRGRDRFNLKKLRIFYVVPLGYPDPLRMYALKKCRGDWVLMLDTDERLSPALKEELGRITGSTGNAALAIKRYEEVKNPRSLPLFFTWQVRLFRRGSVTFRGIPHEQPSVLGTLGKLKKKEHYLMHLSELMSRNTAEQYGAMEKFERLTYELHNKKVMELLSKAVMPSNGNIRDRRLGKFVLALLEGYQRLTLKKRNQELSDFDYFMYYSLLDLAYYIEERNVRGILHILPSERAHLKQIRKWQEDPEGREILEISKAINKTGITKFLGLDNEKTVSRLNKKYKNGGGIVLLLELIKQKHNSGKLTV